MKNKNEFFFGCYLKIEQARNRASAIITNSRSQLKIHEPNTTFDK